MRTIDKSMILKEEVIIPLLAKLVPSARLKRIDDFEFTVSVSIEIFKNRINRNEIVKNLIQICGLNFWQKNDFEIQDSDEILLNSEINESLPMLIDIYIINSTLNMLALEVIIYQNETNLYFDSFIIKGV